MSNSKPEILEKVLVALKGFFDNDRSLLSFNASERSISHKLGEHLQREFSGWHVDCEYNRFGDRTKKTLPRILFGPIRDDDEEAKTIFPDIIVHRRNRPDNLLVIEIKKSNSSVGFENDEIKLKAFTDSAGDYNYKVGLFIEFDVNKQAISTLRCFEGGHEVPLDATMKAELEALGYGL